MTHRRFLLIYEPSAKAAMWSGFSGEIKKSFEAKLAEQRKYFEEKLEEQQKAFETQLGEQLAKQRKELLDESKLDEQRKSFEGRFDSLESKFELFLTSLNDHIKK